MTIKNPTKKRLISLVAALAIALGGFSTASAPTAQAWSGYGPIVNVPYRFPTMWQCRLAHASIAWQGHVIIPCKQTGTKEYTFYVGRFFYSG